MASNPKPLSEFAGPLFAPLKPVPFTEHDVLDGRVMAALQDSLLDERQRDVLRCVAAHRGAHNAVSAFTILDLLHFERSEKSRRWLKATIEDLVTRLRVPIGASRGKIHGYFLIVTRGDLDVAVNPLVGEITSLARRVRALTNSETTAALVGQALLKLDQTDD
jgi:hypothetical protein